jgi:Flp pilus assembly protein TadG
LPFISRFQSVLDAPVLRRLKARLAAFGADEGGAVAVLVAAAIIPLIGALGLATDTARGYMVKARLSQALDAAALAGGKVMLSPDIARDADIEMYFNANFPPGYMGADVSDLVITENVAGDVLEVTATATINTTFMQVLGFDTLTVAAVTAVTRQVDQLDLVLTIDTSGSMGSPSSKIEGARDAANDLVDILFGDNTESPTVTVDGTTYNLLNIGVVNWNSKANVTVAGETYNSALTVAEDVPSFTNPVTGAAQTVMYYANNSPVPLLSAPDTNWTGCVYARYSGDASNTNDADMSLGPVTVDGAQWLGWEPIPTLEGEPRSGSWNTSSNGEPSSSHWYGDNRSCYGAYWNDDDPDPDHPVAVLDQPAWWYTAAPTINNPHSNDCVSCPDVGVLPLETDKQTITDLIDSLTPGGTTNIPTGLAWAWEVLMPGAPFAEAVETLPFPRQRAIVLLTDGENNGGNGDAYKGRFGSGTAAGTTTNAAHGYLPSPPDAVNTRNNLNNRLKRLAANVKAMGIALYVIQFDEDSPTLTALLSSVATEPNAPYYFNAPTVAELQSAFQQIAANLSKLRLSK